jgi:GGDEF domain-containing protein
MMSRECLNIEREKPKKRWLNELVTVNMNYVSRKGSLLCGGMLMDTSVAPRKNKGKSTSFFDMLAFPPLLLVPVFIVTKLADKTNGNSGTFMPAFMFIAMLLSYAVMSVAFITLRKKGLRVAANAVSMIANGVILIFFSIVIGTGGVFGWLGTIILTCGLIIAVAQIASPPSTRFPKISADLLPDSVSELEVKKLLDAMDFPSAFLKKDDNGEDWAIAVNGAFSALVGETEKEIKEKLFSEIVPDGEESSIVRFSGKEWIPHRTARGKQTLFMLTPAVIKKTENAFSGPRDAIDPETGLFTQLFLKYRASADVESCRRYGRKLSVLLFRISFDNAPITPSDKAKKNAYAVFGKMVTESLRACDSGYRLNEDEVLVYLPDTPQGGAKTVSSRIMDRVRKLSKVECVELGIANIQEVSVNYFGEDVFSVDQVMNDIYVEMGRDSKFELSKS